MCQIDNVTTEGKRVKSSTLNIVLWLRSQNGVHPKDVAKKCEA